jgi:deoxyribodipyrimidine photolyase
MKTLLIENHLFALSKYYDQFDRILYKPIIHTELKHHYLAEHFKSIQGDYPKLQWHDEHSDFSFDRVLCWNALNERRIYADKRIELSNRLFENIPFKIPQGFTSFRKQVEPLLPAYYEDALAPQSKLVIEKIKFYFYENEFALNYFETRNQLCGKDFSTQFSLLLSNGLLDVKYLYNEIKDFEKRKGSNKSTYWLVFELLWREFFYHHYQEYPLHYFSQNGLDGKLHFPKIHIYSKEELKSISENPFYQAALTELFTKGFHSNRVRQMFASFWLNDLNLNWLDGAMLYERQLLDYDIFSNYGNWMYLAGVGVDPRGKRYFNIEKQLKQYDPKSSYLKTFYKDTL